MLTNDDNDDHDDDNNDEDDDHRHDDDDDDDDVHDDDHYDDGCFHHNLSKEKTGFDLQKIDQYTSQRKDISEKLKKIGPANPGGSNF